MSLLLVALIAVSVLTGCNENTPPDASEIEARDIGQGSVEFRFEVTDNEEETTVWNVRTDEVTIGAALVEVGLIGGEEASFGLMVIYVNGLRADFNQDGAYWAFYIDGEFASTGVDSTETEPDKVYAFVYTSA
ncbi:MAG: DUF4430 domain-containing protein [Oscillospiraceae bacterium]|nr:DUF4430 domain-containing protein [Oscillospiraceae bacterium]